MKITTHVLDTSKGCPAGGVRIVLYRVVADQSLGSGADQWVEIAGGQTNEDGRISDWVLAEMGDGLVQMTGIYKMKFETKAYFDRLAVASFYPFVEIHFEITRDGHFHIPLLISPFGYSTYRGS